MRPAKTRLGGNSREANRTPATGKLLRRPDSTWAGLFSLSEACAHFFPACSHRCDLRRGLNVRFLRHRGIYRPMTLSSERSRSLPPTAPSQALTAPREDCAVLIVPMSSGRLFLGGLLASRARLRFTGTLNLPRLFQGSTETGHFYFAGMRTLLLCLDTFLFGVDRGALGRLNCHRSAGCWGRNKAAAAPALRSPSAPQRRAQSRGNVGRPSFFLFNRASASLARRSSRSTSCSNAARMVAQTDPRIRVLLPKFSLRAERNRPSATGSNS
jgi:hypothetical protein